MPQSYVLADNPAYGNVPSQKTTINVPDEGEYFYTDSGGGGQQLGQRRGNELVNLGFQYPTDWQGKTIGQWQNEATGQAVGQLGLSNIQNAPSAGDLQSWMKAMGITSRTETDLAKFISGGSAYGKQAFTPGSTQGPGSGGMVDPTPDNVASDAAQTQPIYDPKTGTWTQGGQSVAAPTPVQGGIGPGDGTTAGNAEDPVFQANKQALIQSGARPDLGLPDPNKTGQDALKYAESLGKAPQDAGEARAMMGEVMPKDTSAQDAQGALVNQTLANDPGYQQLLADRAEFNSVANQSASLLDFYNKAITDAGIPAMNAELLNTKNIIEGTEEDIRNEVQAVSGFATDSQVLALAQARNKSLIKNYNALLDAKSMAMESINNMVNLAGQDREFALNSVMQKLQIDQQIMEYRDRFIQNAREGYNNIINAVGYEGLYKMLEQDPNALRLAEQTLGLGQGQLQGITYYIQQQNNLSLLADRNITSPFIDRGGTVMNTRTGYEYTSQEDFLQKTGMTIQNAVAQGLVPKLPLTREDEQMMFDRQMDVARFGLEEQRVGLEQQRVGLEGARVDIARDQLQLDLIKAVGDANAIQAKQQGTLTQAKIVTGKVDEALKQLEKGVASGFIAGFTKNVPGSYAYNLSRTIDTIQANVGFEALQAMRDASPTGGALGQVSEREIALLQSTIASLDIGQSRDQLRANLNQVKQSFENVETIITAEREGKEVTTTPEGKVIILE